MTRTSCIVVALFLVASATSRRLSTRSIVDNEIEPNVVDYESPSSPAVVVQPSKSWVKISQPPQREVRAKYGEPVELECEASGSPPPVIQWYKDTAKLTHNEIISNEITEYPLQGLAKARARLRLGSVEQTEIYFCRAVSGNKVARASTKVVVEKNLSEFFENEIRNIKGKSGKQQLPALVTFYDTIYMDNIGNTVEFPCKSTGSLPIETMWLNPQDQIVRSGGRFAVLPSGGLRISDIHWNDMGPYTCAVKNDLGQDSITTFLYPMLADK